jgi:hypothetical protein
MKPLYSLKHSEAKFELAVSQLINVSKTNPIYSHSFCQYYRESTNLDSTNSTVVIMSGTIPVVAIIFSLGKTTEAQINYFGLPAQLLISPIFDDETIDSALVLLFQEIRAICPVINKGKFINSFKLEIDASALRHKRVEKLFFSNNIVEPKFDRIIELSGKFQISYSKSVKQALKESKMDIRMISKKNHFTEIQEGISSLKSLHFKSAGRKTRSEKSWELQAKMVESGSAILLNGLNHNKIVTSALFMLNLNAAFYAVSASNRSETGLGLSHQLINYAIQEFSSLGITEIWMGEQYTYSIKSISEKERQIQDFKGYFGGRLNTHLISIARPTP